MATPGAAEMRLIAHKPHTLEKDGAIVERSSRAGGAGINTGTVPSKTLREAALYYSGLRQRGLYGIDYSLKESMSVADFMHREHIVIENEHKLIKDNLDRHAITLIHGEATLKDAHTVRITSAAGEKEIHGDVILIATGSSLFHPSGIPFDGNLIFDSDTILHMNRIPKTMAVVGGGVIGLGLVRRQRRPAPDRGWVRVS